MKLIIYVFVISVVYNVNANVLESPLITTVYENGKLMEGPHYAEDENALYWVDTVEQKILRLDTDTGDITSRKIGYGPISTIVRVKDFKNLLVVSARSELYLLPWDTLESDVSLRLIAAVDTGLPNNRIDDGKVDAKGRLWFGTMGKEDGDFYEQDKGSLFMLRENNFANPELKVRPVSISNGIAWTSDNKQMFYIDSLSKKIDAFDFDLEAGIIGNRSTLFDYVANNVTGYPDGMTIDRDDNLWVACYEGGKIIKIDSKTGTLIGQIELPAYKVTSLTWGGCDLTTLYVTTRNHEPLKQSGKLFAIYNTGGKGYPANQLVFPNADKY